MFKAFYWMFKNEKFKEHFVFIAKYIIILSVICLVLLSFANLVSQKSISGQILTILAIIVHIAMTLFFYGYCWELTANIISRGKSVIASNIYNNNIKVEEVIELPEINILKMTWRGFASFVAILLLFLPLYLVVVFYIASSVMNSLLMNASSLLLIILGILIALLLPGLLWNYAKRNSIVAVWNLPKAIYLIGNYPLRYISRIFIMYIFFFIIFCLCTLVTKILMPVPATLSQASVDYFVILLIQSLISCLIGIYGIYVIAYLLGTIAPSEEG